MKVIYRSILSKSKEPSISSIQTFTATPSSITVQATTVGIPTNDLISIYLNENSSTQGGSFQGSLTQTQLSQGVLNNLTLNRGSTYYIFFKYNGNWISSPITSYYIKPILEYPPTSNLTGYTVSVSSGLYMEKLFNKVNDGYWISASRYDDAFPPPSNPTATAAITSGIKGEWIQIILPVPIILTSYSLTATPISFLSRCPLDWTILGSNDGTSWTIVESVTGNGFYNSYETKTFNVMYNDSSPSYTYFRFIVSRIYKGTQTFLSEWRLYGF